MPPTRSSSRVRARNAGAHPYANAAAAQPTGFLKLPAELRDGLYDTFAKDVNRVRFDASKPIRISTDDALAMVCPQIRSEYLVRVQHLDRVTKYHILVKDFDFSRVIRYLTENQRGYRATVVKISLNCTQPEIDYQRVVDWSKFCRAYMFRPRYKVVGMCPAKQRRLFMTDVDKLQYNFGLKKHRGDYGREVLRITEMLMKWWGDGKREMKWAEPGEKHPMGKYASKAQPKDEDDEGFSNDEED